MKQTIESMALTLKLQGNKVASQNSRFNGMITLNADGATFVEATNNRKTRVRPQRIYDGDYVTLTCNADGHVRINLRNIQPWQITSDLPWDIYNEVSRAIEAITPLCH